MLSSYQITMQFVVAFYILFDQTLLICRLRDVIADPVGFGYRHHRLLIYTYIGVLCAAGLMFTILRSGKICSLRF